MHLEVHKIKFHFFYEHGFLLKKLLEHAVNNLDEKLLTTSVL